MRSWNWKRLLVGWVLLSSPHGGSPKGRHCGVLGRERGFWGGQDPAQHSPWIQLSTPAESQHFGAASAG